MTVEKNSAKKARTHTVYKNAAGKRVPGVTTITGVLDKPALVRWANNLGLQGIDSSKYVDDLATIGTLAHYMVECHLKETEPELDDFSKNQIDSAENSFIKFLDWQKKNEFTLIDSEMKLVSEKHQYGGTCDCYCSLNGVETLIDIKTCKGIYDGHFTQVAGYKIALQENNFPVQESRILRIGRNESEGFEDKLIPNMDLHVKRFLLCRDICSVNAEIRRAK